MKRKILTVASVLMIAAMLVSLVPLSYLMRFHDVEAIIGSYEEKENSLDVVYIGGSACCVFWEPLRAWDEYGFTSYNYANNMITPVQPKYSMIEAMKTQSPRLWIIDVRPFEYGEEFLSGEKSEEIGIRNASDSMKYSLNRLRLINASVPDAGDRLAYYFDIIKYHSNWYVAANLIFKAVITRNTDMLDYADGGKVNGEKGFYFSEKTVKACEYEDFSAISESLPIGENCERILVDLLEFCRDKSQSVLFIVHSYCQTEDQKMKYNYMEEIITSYGFDFLNMNDYSAETGLDYSHDFYDNDHVNIFGAEKYTDFLGAYLKENYALPDRRTDPAFSEWSEFNEKFEQRVADKKDAIMNGEYENDG